MGPHVTTLIAPMIMMSSYQLLHSRCQFLEVEYRGKEIFCLFLESALFYRRWRP